MSFGLLQLEQEYDFDSNGGDVAIPVWAYTIGFFDWATNNDPDFKNEFDKHVDLAKCGSFDTGQHSAVNGPADAGACASSIAGNPGDTVMSALVQAPAPTPTPTSIILDWPGGCTITCSGITFTVPAGVEATVDFRDIPAADTGTR